MSEPAKPSIEPAAHMLQSELALFARREMTAFACSVPFSSANDGAIERSVPLVTLRQVHDAIEALLEALQWREQFDRRPGEDANDTFERVAEAFNRETGYLRPGKDCVVHSHEERAAAWDAWIEAGRARSRVAIAKATGGAS